MRPSWRPRRRPNPRIEEHAPRGAVQPEHEASPLPRSLIYEEVYDEHGKLRPGIKLRIGSLPLRSGERAEFAFSDVIEEVGADG